MPKLIETIANVAPTVATALGGPLAGTAATFILKALGVDAKGKDPVAVLEEKVKADPTVVLELKKLDYDFQKFLKEKDIRLEELENADRDSARNREIQVKDRMPGILAVSVSVGFFGVLYYIMTHNLPAENKDVVMILLGSLGTAWTGIIAYYFGSSAGSKQKTDALSAAVTAAKK